MDDWMTTRRAVVTGVAAAVAWPALATGGRQGRIALIAGTYAAEGGKGLYPVSYDPRADRWQVGTPVTGIEDASFGVGGGPGGTWYLVRERAAGRLAAYGPDWRERGVAATLGADPCHVAIDRRSGCLAVANYSGGSVAFYRLDPVTGVPGEPVLFRHTGSGPDRDRQQGAHAHWVGFSPDRRYLHSVDLGADAIFAYRFDAVARTLAAPVTAWRAPAGSGPRHLVHHPRLPIAYVVGEMANVLMTLRAGADGGFVTQASVSTLPAGFAGASQAAHIAIDRAGRRLYVSNRGHDSIAVFALGTNGSATLIQHVGCGGHWPRIFRLLEGQARLVVGNERSGSLAVFAIGGDGRLTDTGQRLAVPGVVFLGEVTA